MGTLLPKDFEAELEEIDLVDGDWVKIRKRLSYGEVEGLNSEDAEAMAKGKTSIPLFMLCIREWSFKESEEDLEPAPITSENIKRLDILKAAKVMEAIAARYPLG